MRRLAPALTVAACLGALAAPPSHGSCPARVIYRGVTYTGSQAPHPVERGERVGKGVLPACRDVIFNGEPPPAEKDRPVTVYRAGAVNPKLALMAGQDDAVYLAMGFILESPRHPLHRAFYGSKRRPDAAKGQKCGTKSVRAAGRARDPAFFGRVFLRGPGADRTVAIDALTKLHGRTRLGVPYVGTGDRVVAAGIRCGDELVARNLRWSR